MFKSKRHFCSDSSDPFKSVMLLLLLMPQCVYSILSLKV